MANKVWTATGIQPGAVIIHPPAIDEGGVNSILVERGYVFVNNGSVLNDVGGRGWSEYVPVADIPADILQALQQIDAWTRGRILAREGME